MTTMTQADPTVAPAAELREVTKVYPGDNPVTALDAVSLPIARGAFLAVMGPSGSGKSTLLNCAAGLDVPTSGSVRIADTEIGGMKENQRTRLRRERVGFVFQSYQLLPALTVEQNITLPLRLAGQRPDRDWVLTIADRVGITELFGRRPAELSGGQQQRAAIVRALVARPEVVFADEPTGALDLRSAAEILRLLAELVAEFRQTVVMVTHDPAVAAAASHTVVMADGRIHDIIANPSADQLAHKLTTLEGR